jgi:hypothetical protein
MSVGTRMLMTTHEVDEDWSNPTILKEDGGDDEADSDPIKEGQKQIDRLICAIGDNYILSHFLNVI